MRRKIVIDKDDTRAQVTEEEDNRILRMYFAFFSIIKMLNSIYSLYMCVCVCLPPFNSKKKSSYPSRFYYL